MKTLGIISEYNPFHNGHKYQLDKAKEMTHATHSIAVMSGNFTQRGELAIFDKYKRAEIAVSNGIDLVIELPFVYAASSAEFFAGGAVQILNNLGILDYLSFGIEDTNKLGIISETASILNNENTEFQTRLKYYLNNGNSFAVSREKTLAEITGKDMSFLSSPNTILALEYIKELKKLNSSIKIAAINRKGAQHNSNIKKDSFASATYIRNKLLKSKSLTDEIAELIPKNSQQLFSSFSKSKNINTLENYFSEIKAMILKSSAKELRKYPEVEEGLQNRIYDNIYKYNDIEDFIDFVSSKRHTKNKIRRILLNILTEYKLADRTLYAAYNPGFIKVLAFNDNGREIVRKIKNNSDINIFLNYNKDINKLGDTDKKIIEKNIQADNIYNLRTGNEFNFDFYNQPLYIKD